ncbi:MAG TPA: hypothetical protein VF039_08910 [Longimicrobiales bacterium]
MNLDIRLPIGVLFTLLGMMLVPFGLAADGAINARSLGHNLNLWWGLVMLAFGVVLLLLARRSTTPTVRQAMDDPEGRATEEREKREGLERQGP